MRAPSRMSDLLAWHRATLAGEDAPWHDGECYCGYFKRRLIKQGPWVAVRIYVERELDEHGYLATDERFVMDVEGLRSDDDPRDAFSWLTPISREDYEHLLDLRLRDTRFFDGRQKIDLTETPTLPTGVY